MISAKEARRKTLLNTKLKDIMGEIERSINNAIEDGQNSTDILFRQSLDPYILETLTKELESLGYIVAYKPADPLPIGCPVDQWNFNDYLLISWKVEE